MPAHKLQGKLEFQGLPISIENRKGSLRHWYDPSSDTDGSTKMTYPYGYVRGTLGMDGDAVDVFVGVHEDAPNVFVITQNKAPEFTEVDEQKVFLGFKTASDAKAAYLKHYDNPKFFREMKTMSMEDFKERLNSQRGKLIKSTLFLACKAGMITAESMSSKTFEELDAVTKALTAAVASKVAKDARRNLSKAAVSSPTALALACSELGEYPLVELGALVAILRAASVIHQSHHWQVQGDNYYGDHQLFQRIYEESQAFIDSVAERSVGLGVPELVNAKSQATIIPKLVNLWSKESKLAGITDRVSYSLTVEQSVLQCIRVTKERLESRGLLTDGTDNLLQGVADKHEEFTYLLQQRSRGGTSESDARQQVYDRASTQSTWETPVAPTRRDFSVPDVVPSRDYMVYKSCSGCSTMTVNDICKRCSGATEHSKAVGY